MGYKIKPYSYQQADKLGVVIRPSKVKGKKIDVFSNGGDKICSIGAIGYNDYPTYLEKEGLNVAEMHRKAYKARHEEDRKVKGSAGYYADKILW